MIHILTWLLKAIIFWSIVVPIIVLVLLLAVIMWDEKFLKMGSTIVDYFCFSKCDE